MTTYVVAYDLINPGQKYECLRHKLEAYGTYWHIQQSVWLIKTSATAVQIRDNLNSCIDANDKLIVAGLTGEAAWAGHDAHNSRWLRETAFA